MDLTFSKRQDWLKISYFVFSMIMPSLNPGLILFFAKKTHINLCANQLTRQTEQFFILIRFQLMRRKLSPLIWWDSLRREDSRTSWFMYRSVGVYVQVSWSLCTGQLEFMYRSTEVYIQIIWRVCRGQVKFMCRREGVYVQVRGSLCTGQPTFMYRSGIVYVQVKWSLCTGQVDFMHRSAGVYVQVRRSLCTGQVEFMYRSGGVYVQVSWSLCAGQE